MNSKNSGYFGIEKIIKGRLRNGRKEYLIKWVGYPKDQNSWECYENLNEQTRLFLEDHPIPLMGFRTNYPYTEFTRHNGKALLYAYEVKLTNVDEAQCLSSCLTERRFLCRSVDYWITGRICYINSQTKWSSQIELKHSNHYVHFEVNKEIFPYNQFKTYKGYTSTIPRDVTYYSVSTLEECLFLCLKNPLLDCQSIDYYLMGTCYHNGPANTNITTNIIPNNQYIHAQFVPDFPVNQFNRTVSRALIAYNDIILRGEGLDECLRSCLRGPPFICHSVDHIVPDNSCYMSVETWVTTGTELGVFYKTNYWQSIQAECLEGDFACEHGWTCLKSWLVCDGKIHCPDGSDELRCSNDCGVDEFRGEDGGIHGMCISNDLVCDGYNHCHAGTDESEKTCIVCRGFKCDSGECLHASLQCDGIIDCVDNSDERGCQIDKCEDKFRCVNLKCVNLYHRCDYVNDCGDWSDEWGCNYRRECYTTRNGIDYRGNINRTVSGRICQKWSDQFPHRHQMKPENHRPTKGLGDHNYCRNPNGDKKPWCYTTDPDVRRESCNAGVYRNICTKDYCPSDSFICDDGTCIDPYYRCNARNDCPDRSDEVNCISQEFGLGCYRKKGTLYRGFAANVTSGLPCIPWENSMSKYTPQKKPNSGLEGAYCRNPDKEYIRPWCFHVDDSQDKIGWSYCDIPHCSDGNYLQSHWPLPLNWSHPYFNLINDTELFNTFETRFYTSPGFERVKGETSPDWYGFMTFSSNPDYSDLEQVFKIKPDETVMYGHQAQDFILHCSFNQRQCYYTDFRIFTNDKYGNCFTFNHGSNNTEILNSTQAGSSYGLRLTLFTEQNEYISIFGQDSGVRVSIHDHRVEPFPEEDGLTVRPGAVTSVSMKQGKIQRLGHPYGNCSDGHDWSDNGYMYTLKSCQHRCIQHALLTECGCVDRSTNDDRPRCMVLNQTQEICRQFIYFLYQHALLDCECLKSCSESWYDKTISQSFWPSESYLKRLLKSLHSVNRKTSFIRDSVDAQRNLVGLSIYYDELNYEKFTENPNYMIEKLFGDIGGSLGLYIGLSLLTVVEFLELLYHVLRYLLTITLRAIYRR
ncbi:uncharacterized protein LOC102808261 [Saccoglossus kowalevskii]